MNATMTEALGELRKSSGFSRPENGAWQSRGNLHELPPFQQLSGSISAASKGVLDFLKLHYDSFAITNCWANINPKGHSHGFHTHPNNFLSGVYYVRAPENCGDIEFHDPRAQATVLIPKVNERNPFNAWKQSLTPKEGQLLVFHSWFQHLVQENQSEEERISISFNIMLKGEVGYESGGAQF